METGFFRFYQSEKGNPNVYSTSLISLLITSSAFMVFAVLIRQPMADVLGYSMHPEYIVWMGLIIGFDAITAIPFVYLRQKNKALRFASIKIANILVNIALNLFFLVLCPWLISQGTDVPTWLYNPEIGVGYVFISNLIASISTLLLLLPEFHIKWNFDKQLWKQMLIYSLPLLVGGFAGMINETFDRAMLKRLLPDAMTAMDQLGIYGANYKVAILMTIFVQTFRFAAEPFFFNQAKETNARELYATVMKYFIIFALIIFLGVVFYIDLVKYFIGPEFRSGLGVVPILLMANLFLGIFFNLSIWYKLTNKTRWGAWLAIFGAVITIALNFWLIPVMGYMGSAWATLVCYFLMMLASFILGQMFYKVPYPFARIGIYFAVAGGLYALSIWIRQDDMMMNILLNSVLLGIFVACVVLLEKDIKRTLLRR
jgi:O-antigen/teichoic acid export membrane protein